MSVSFIGLPEGGCIDRLGMGVFDGIHRGHQQLIASCSHVMTFSPHPLHVLKPEVGLKRLTTFEEMRVIDDRFFALKFDADVAGLSAKQFFDEVICSQLRPKSIVVGEDFRFGTKQQGTARLLREWGEVVGIDVMVIGLASHHEHIVKSSLIRQLIGDGMFAEAVDLMGHAYSVSGEVVHGDHRGRTLGFPTANLAVAANKLLPQPGVYAGTCEIGFKTYKTAVYIGDRATFGLSERVVEVHLIGFDGDVYGQRLMVQVDRQIREDKTFSSAEALVAQIEVDLMAI